ncbi:MAG: ABC transporter ATP-binding protein [Deltaproteobacteria bacterium]|nr:MAG: ABC transporter ATP-binding protein [Deltaproteobacteria bacterium]
MPKFCRFCGHELKNPNARFCPACGKRLSSPPSPATPSRPARPLEIPSDQPRLIIRTPGQPVQEIPLDRPVFTIGRRPDNDIILSLPYVSGHHGRLERVGETWHYTDLGSTNGTYINGRRMQRVSLGDGDVLRIGDPTGNSVGITFRAALTAEEDALSSTMGIMRIGALPLETRPSLIVGRDPQADVPLQAPIVSWHHARLERVGQRHVLTDLNSTNGTFVNGQRVTHPHTLQEGDVVQIGPFKLVYDVAGFQQYAASGGMRLDGVGLIREVGGGRRILNDISISVFPREFISLVGTSGAGKSTLMMALNGFVRAQQGQVLVNGDNLYQHFDLYRTTIGYVPQDDIIHKGLTVVNALRYAARLRLPPDTSDAEIEQRIDQVLRDVEMLGQKGQVVSSLSGGQRKRVSIAVELLAEPNLFFLDEPTSGLDPGLEKKMMYTLRRLADGGRTIVLVTHATANIVQCDHVCFLSQGRMVYFGPPTEALNFFGVTSGDFADIYAQLDDPDPQVARQKAAASENRFKSSPYYQQYVAHRQQTLPQVQQQTTTEAATLKGPKVSSVQQFFVLTRRYLDLVLRDKLLLTVLMVVMPIIGVLVLLVSDSNWLVGNTIAEIERQLVADLAAGNNNATYTVIGDSQTLLFIMALAAVLLGLFASAYEIVKERSVYQRERMVTLRIFPYIASKVIVLGIFALIQCLLLMIVIRFKVDYPGEGVFLPAPLEMYITLVLGTMAAITMGLLISALAPNANTVIYLVLLVLFFQMIFAGVLFDLPGITDHFSALTLTRWSMEGLGSSANMEHLNSLTRTRFQPDPVTEVASMEVEKPADDWEPITVVTKTESILVPCPSGITVSVPITVPEITENEMVTVTEIMTETVTVEPDPTDIFNEREFRINYDRTTSHLLLDWGMLIGFTVFFGLATAIVLKRQDVG